MNKQGQTKKPTDTGLNRTGIQTSPLQSKELIAGASRAAPLSTGNERDLMEMNLSYMKEAEPIGTVPPPGTLKGAAKTVLKKLGGEQVNVFIDKLGERLGFERTGTRLYQGLLAKLEAYGSWEGGPTREELGRIHDEELAHFILLKQCMEELGADPTAVTPSADVAFTASTGVAHVIHDARTTLLQSLDAILVVELVDNACWETLIQLARAYGQEDMATRFEQALRDEERHLAFVHAWVMSGLGAEGKVTLVEQPSPQP